MAEAVTKYLPDSGLFHYNLVDLAATRLSFDRLRREGACEMALFDHAMTGPALTMSLRGLRVDESAAAAVLEETWDDGRRLRRKMDRIRKFDWTGKAIKPKPHELAAVLYDELRAPVQSNRDGGRTVNKEALDAIINSPKSSDEAVVIAEAALELTRLEEDRKVIEKPRGRDGRFHTGMGVATTVTSRWSSRKDAFNEGGNLHAMNRRVRRIFIADDGYVLVNRDLSQAESLGVAFLSGCEAYKRAHYEGNVHLFVGNKLWPRPKPWTKDTAKAPVPFNPDLSFYDLFKRRQHAGNYGQTPYGFARLAHIPLHEAKRSDAAYFTLFPEIRQYHQEVKYQLETFKRLVTPMGRVRQFLGRAWSAETLKEAIAHVPQSMISDINKIILWRIWRHLDPHLGMTLLEVHDSVLCQVRERDVADFVRESTKMAQVEIPVNGDTLVIGSEVSAGRNWGDWDAKKNPTGLKKVGGG